MNIMLYLLITGYLLCFSSLQKAALKNNPVDKQEETIINLFKKKKEITLVDQETIEKLDIFSLKEQSLFSSINRTTTLFGKIMCQEMLLNPSTDKEIILHRQEIIKELYLNKILLHKIYLNLQKIKKTEKVLIHYFQEKNDTDKEIDSYYFPDLLWLDSCNSSSIALETSRRFQQIALLSSIAIIPIMDLLATSFNYETIYNYQIFTNKEKMGLEASPSQTGLNWSNIVSNACEIPFNSINPFPSIFKDGYDKTIIVNKSKLTLGDHISEENYNSISPKFLLYGKNYAKILFYGYGLTKMIATIPKAIFEKNNKIAELQKNMNDIASFIDAYDSLLTLMKESKNIKKLISHDSAINQKLDQFKKAVNSPAIKEDSSAFMYGGKILVAHKLMQEIKDILIPNMQMIGTIDAYVGIAKLIEEHQFLPSKYCIAQFINSDTPSINFTDFWHPITPKEKAITNSIKLGGDVNPCGIILTGPHGCGKSTAMKAITLNLILAQTFGIVAAKEAQLSIFTKINTYLNIQDNINLGWSTFVAEQARIDTILDSIRNLKSHEFSFNMLDEVFKGTIEKEGAQRTFDCGKELARNKNNLSMIAVHSELPTELEEYTQGIYKNFHVELIENERGQFVKTFKLVPGKNDWWFNDNLKRKRFISYLQKTILGSHITQ